MYARISALLLAFALALTGPAWAQARFGDISGRVTDQQGLPLPGVSVTVTNNENQRSTVQVTDSDGAYYARNLDPGRYKVSFDLSGFVKQEAPDVAVIAGQTAPVDVQLRVGGVTETVQVVGVTPLIDPTSTTKQRTITSEQFETIPKGRSFQSLATALPSVNQGELEGGFQVNGASAGENNFYVDGVTVTSLLHGQQRQDAVFEYLEEVQVRSTGLEAEFGGALGGVISAVTKSGGNTFRGSAFEHFTANWLQANNGVAKRLVLDPATQNTAAIVQDDDQSFSRNEFGFTLGGPIVRNRLFFFGSASPRLEDLTRTYQLPDGTAADVNRERRNYSTFGKVTYTPTGKIQLNLSGLWTPDKATGTAFAYNGFQKNTTTQNQAFIDARNELGYEVPQYNVAYTGDYTFDDRTIASVRGGYMRDNYFDTGVNTSQTFEYATSAVGLAGVPAQWQQPTGFSNLPRVRINDHDITTRNFVDLTLTRLVTAGGTHQFKGGFGWTKNANDVKLAYPNGGYVTIYWDSDYISDATGQAGRGAYGYYKIDDSGTQGKTSATIKNLFIQDNWIVSPRLSVNIGLRTEDEFIPSYRKDIADYGIHFGWRDKLSPRLGVAYNFLEDGRAKLSASYGRYYDWTKYEIARGTFGGDTWTTRYRTLDDPDPTKLSRAALTGTNLWDSSSDSYKDNRIPSFGEDVVDPNMKPMAQDTYNVGLEYQMRNQTVIGVNFVRTNLLRTIEDIGTLVNGSEAYIYGNPGEGLATTAITTGATPPFTLPKAERNYTAMELTASRRFNRNWFLSGSYVLSRLYGNYPGTVNTDEVSAPGFVSVAGQEAFGQRTRPGTNASRAWDLDEMMFDSHGNLGVYGRLPTDRPHVGKIYGSYLFDFGTNVGVNFSASSGTPVSKSVMSVYSYPILVEGRGSLGRTPALTQTNLLVSHQVRLGGSKAVRFEFNAENIFNQQQARHIFDKVNRLGGNGRVLTSSGLRLASVNLLEGYDYNALLAATPDASKPAGSAGAGYQDPRYLMPDIWNPGFSGRFSIRFLF